MPQHRKWTEQRFALIKELIALGWTTSEISKYLGVSKNTFYKACKKYGFKLREHRPKRGWPSKREVELWRLTNQGLSSRQVAAELGVAPSTVRHQLKQSRIYRGRSEKSLDKIESIGYN